MVSFPSSWAIDAAAPGGGPGTTVLPAIVTAQPNDILKYGTQLMTCVTRLVSLFNELSHNQQQLRSAWPSSTASDSANTMLTTTGQSFQQVAGQITQAKSELDMAAKWLQVIQTAYQTIVGGTNPTVASLLSNPTTRPAAHAVAGAATGSLNSLLGSTSGALSLIGLTRIMTLVSGLLQLATQVQQLLSPAATAGTSPAPVPPTSDPTNSLPVTSSTPNPVTPAPVASLPSSTSTGSVTTLPDGSVAVTLPNPAANQWIPVNSSTTPAATPAQAAAAPAHPATAAHPVAPPHPQDACHDAGQHGHEHHHRHHHHGHEWWHDGGHDRHADGGDQRRDEWHERGDHEWRHDRTHS